VSTGVLSYTPVGDELIIIVDIRMRILGKTEYATLSFRYFIVVT